MPRSGLLSTLLISGCVVLGACSGSAVAPLQTLTVYGSAGAPPVLSPAAVDSAPGVESGDAASMLVVLYALWVSPSGDCSDPVLVEDDGDVAPYKDLVQNPTLFSGTPPVGTYRCIIVRMSDVLRMVPAGSFGPCVAGTEYSADIYRDRETDWKDVNLNPIVGHGSETTPVNDHVTVFLTRDTEAAISRGISGNQVVFLGSDLVVPTSSTFYWNGQGFVVNEGGRCSLQPGHPEFR